MKRLGFLLGNSQRIIRPARMEKGFTKLEKPWCPFDCSSGCTFRDSLQSVTQHTRAKGLTQWPPTNLLSFFRWASNPFGRIELSACRA
jgi:hypothetical protein